MEQKKFNEKWMESMISITDNWMWKDECELYEFKNNKIYPKTAKGSKELRKIARTCSIFAHLARMHPDNINMPMTEDMEMVNFTFMWAGD